MLNALRQSKIKHLKEILSLALREIYSAQRLTAIRGKTHYQKDFCLSFLVRAQRLTAIRGKTQTSGSSTLVAVHSCSTPYGNQR